MITEYIKVCTNLYVRQQEFGHQPNVDGFQRVDDVKPDSFHPYIVAFETKERKPIRYFDTDTKRRLLALMQRAYYEGRFSTMAATYINDIGHNSPHYKLVDRDGEDLNVHTQLDGLDFQEMGGDVRDYDTILYTAL